MVKLIAHRGASKEAPENTLASIKRAIDIGVDYVEFDVHLTRDGLPIVIHDALLGRTTDRCFLERLSDLDWADLRDLDAGAWFGKEFARQRIPTLEEVLKLDRGNTGYMIEIKKGHSQIKPLVAKILAAVHSAPRHKIILGSFSVHVLEELRHHDPTLDLMGIIENFNMIPIFRSMKWKRLTFWYKLLNPTLIKNLHEEGTEVWTFTVDDKKTAEFLISIGVDGIITNNPRALKHLAGVRSPKPEA